MLLRSIARELLTWPQVSLRPPTVLIGRNPTCRLVLADVNAAKENI